MIIAREIGRSLAAVTVIAALDMGVAHPDAVRATSALPSHAVQPCPARTVCDAALDIALTLPTGWRRAAPGKYAPGVLALQIPAAPGQPDNDLRLTIAIQGMTSDTNAARAAAAGAAVLIRATNYKGPVTRTMVEYGGAPGVLIQGLPGNGPTTAIVLAHAGRIYQLFVPGAALAADQRQALASVRFLTSAPVPGIALSTPAEAAACGLTFPSSHNLRVISVSSGAGTLDTLASGGYTFTLARYRNFNGYVRQATGLTPSPGDSVLPFAFDVPGGHYYVGLVNVVRQGVGTGKSWPRIWGTTSRLRGV